MTTTKTLGIQFIVTFFRNYDYLYCHNEWELKNIQVTSIEKDFICDLLSVTKILGEKEWEITTVNKIGLAQQNLEPRINELLGTLRYLERQFEMGGVNVLAIKNSLDKVYGTILPVLTVAHSDKQIIDHLDRDPLWKASASSLLQQLVDTKSELRTTIEQLNELVQFAIPAPLDERRTRPIKQLLQTFKAREWSRQFDCGDEEKVYQVVADLDKGRGW